MFSHSYIIKHKDHGHFISEKSLSKLQKFSDININNRAVVSSVLKVFSDTTKLSIYRVLKKVKEISVTDISYVLKISQSTVSHALSDLKKLNYVKSMRCGQLICYSLKKQTSEIERILKVL